jgi:hypothetical protein
MASTKRIPRAEWKSTFERFTKTFLRDDLDETIRIESDSAELGAQVEVDGAVLRGITWDAKSDMLDFFVNDGQHLVLHPKNISVVQDDDGFISSIDVETGDGEHEIAQVRRAIGPMKNAGMGARVS